MPPIVPEISVKVLALSLSFGPLDDPENGERNRRIVEGVVGGISHYGNCFGVPTVGGECVFEPCYNGNPLVNVFALGVFRHDEIFFGRASGIGNPGNTVRWGGHCPARRAEALLNLITEIDLRRLTTRAQIQIGSKLITCLNRRD